MSKQSKSPNRSAKPPVLREQTVSNYHPETGGYDSHFIHQKVTIAFYHNHRLLSVVGVSHIMDLDNNNTVGLDAEKTRRLQAAIQSVIGPVPYWPE